MAKWDWGWSGRWGRHNRTSATVDPVLLVVPGNEAMPEVQAYCVPRLAYRDVQDISLSVVGPMESVLPLRDSQGLHTISRRREGRDVKYAVTTKPSRLLISRYTATRCLGPSGVAGIHRKASNSP
jgi:hypothetical protein